MVISLKSLCTFIRLTISSLQNVLQLFTLFSRFLEPNGQDAYKEQWLLSVW